MKLGYRRYANKVKDIHGMQQILIDFKPNRCDSEVYMNTDIDVTEFVKFIKKLKKDNKSLTYYHGIMTVIAKTLYSRPRLNRFIQNRKMFEHKDIILAQVVKEEFTEGAVEALLAYKVKEDDTLLTISKEIRSKVDKIRRKEKSDIDGTADILGHIPNLIRVPLIGILKWIDKIGYLPNSLIDNNIYYSSAVLSDIGSFKTGAIHHNLTNFGTSSMLITFGEIKEVNGKYLMELGATLDERIADGFYMCKALKLIEYMFKHPELLLDKVSTKVSVPKEER